MKQEKIFSKTILLFYYMINFYYSYRYIFKYNNDITSPTYSNTPVILQNFKYYIALVFGMICVCVLVYSRTKIEIGIVEVILFVLASGLLIKSIIIWDFVFFIKYYAFLGMAYFVVFIKDTNTFLHRVLMASKVIFLFHVIYSAIQIFMYLYFNRLPALAYKGGIVRFGGGWDDPNSFGIYICLPTIFLLCNIMDADRSWMKYVLLLICIILEILTISLAGYCGLLISLIFFIAKYRKKISKRIVVWFVSGGIIFLIWKAPYVYQIFKWKRESMLLHLGMLLPELAGDNILSFWFGGIKYEYSENFYNVALKNGGIICWIGMIFLACYGIYISYFIYKSNKQDIVKFCCMVFLIAFAIAQMGIPYSLCVPVNYLYWIIYFYTLNIYRKTKAIL